MRVLKYPLAISAYNHVRLHQGAQLLDVQMQNGIPQLWVLVTESNPIESRNIAVFGAGQEVPANIGPHIATFQVHDLGYVFHAFEVVA